KNLKATFQCRMEDDERHIKIRAMQQREDEPLADFVLRMSSQYRKLETPIKEEYQVRAMVSRMTKDCKMVLVTQKLKTLAELKQAIADLPGWLRFPKKMPTQSQATTSASLDNKTVKEGLTSS